MAVLRLVVQHDYFCMLMRGEKTVEGRLATPKYRALRLGDCLLFVSASTSDTYRAVVRETRCYTTFRAMLEAQGVKPFLGDGAQSIDDACRVYSSFGSYKKDEERFGAIAISFEHREDM